MYSEGNEGNEVIELKQCSYGEALLDGSHWSRS